MDRKDHLCIWKDESKEDINTIKFLELLLKYDYTWYQNDNEMKLNLTETDKSRFLQECRDSIEYIDEMKASLIIEIIRHQFKEEFFRLQKSRRNADQPILPWFYQAYRLFQKSSISEASPITSSCIPTVAIASNTPPASVSALKITNASMSATALSSTSTVKPFSWTTVLPYWKLPSLGQEKQLANPSSSREDVYYDESSLRKVKPQYDFPIIYPECILPCFSLGRSGEGSDTCSRKKSESHSSKVIPANLSSSSHQSDFSYLSGNEGIPIPTNSNRPDSCHSQITTKNRNSLQSASPLNALEHTVTGFATNSPLAKKVEAFINSRCSPITNQNVNTPQPASSLNTLKQIVTGFTASNSLEKKFETVTRYRSFSVPFQLPTSKTSPVPRGAMSSGTRAKYLNPKRGKFKVHTSRLVKTKSPTLLPPR